MWKSVQGENVPDSAQDGLSECVCPVASICPDGIAEHVRTKMRTVRQGRTDQLIATVCSVFYT